jgi:hypothetical protein
VKNHPSYGKYPKMVKYPSMVDEIDKILKEGAFNADEVSSRIVGPSRGTIWNQLHFGRLFGRYGMLPDVSPQKYYFIQDELIYPGKEDQ